MDVNQPLTIDTEPWLNEKPDKSQQKTRCAQCNMWICTINNLIYKINKLLSSEKHVSSKIYFMSIKIHIFSETALQDEVKTVYWASAAQI